MIPLSDNTQQLIERLFEVDDQRAAGNLLTSCCGESLPLVDDDYPELAERIRFAVLRLSHGNFNRLIEAVEVANVDWRDSLVDAGFAEDESAHLRWFSNMLQ